MEHLKGADADGYHAAIEATGLEYRICGHAPTYLAFRAFQPEKGEILAHEVWDDAETDSAVSFATVAFS